MTDAESNCARHPDSSYVEFAVEVFSILADATRVRLILSLRDEELSINQLAGIVDMHPTAVSQHLSKMRLTRIVATRQDGTRVFYSLADEHAVALVDEALKQEEHAVGALHHHQ